MPTSTRHARHASVCGNDGLLPWRVQSTVGALTRRADEARAAGKRADADALLLSAWAAFDG